MVLLPLPQHFANQTPLKLKNPLMASATTTPAFTFHTVSSKPSPKPKPTHYSFTAAKFHNPLSIHLSPSNYHLRRHSIDVSNEDTPILNELDPSPDDATGLRRIDEKFAVLNTGIYECRSCGYTYDESVGDPAYPIPPGLPYEQIPDDWRCPTCGAAKNFFQSKSVEIAGFAQNQQYGLGGNTLTEGQKAALIYGSLVFFFALFLSGYFLQ